jgi:hypothetical protein
MRRYDATLAYNCYYIASIGYTLAATKLSLTQCNSIQSPVICATLNKMGINRNVAQLPLDQKMLVDLKCITYRQYKETHDSNTSLATSCARMETAI